MAFVRRVATKTGRPRPAEVHPNPIDPRVVIGHVHLKTADIQRVYDFYVGILGFEVIERRPDALFVSAGGYHHHLGFNAWHSAGGAAPDQSMTGLYHTALRYPDRATFVDAVRRVSDAGWPIDSATDHGTHEAVYVTDPDGNGVELCWDRPDDEWPLDADGLLAFSNAPLEVASILEERQDVSQQRRPPAEASQ